MHCIRTPQPDGGQPVVGFHDVQKPLIFRPTEQRLWASGAQAVGGGVKVNCTAIGVHRPRGAAAHFAEVVGARVAIKAKALHFGQAIFGVNRHQGSLQTVGAFLVHRDPARALRQVPINPQIKRHGDGLQPPCDLWPRLAVKRAHVALARQFGPDASKFTQRPACDDFRRAVGLDVQECRQRRAGVVAWQQGPAMERRRTIKREKAGRIMPRNMSFFLTQPQVRAQQKDVTRRFGWWTLKAGDVVNAVVKSQGIPKGQKIERICQIEIVSTRTEPLNAITQDDCIREGFPDLSPADFVAMLTTHYRCPGNEPCNRIAFRYI
jgi:hypothetical protein